MIMEISKYKILAALVRSFFDAFSSGIIDNSDVAAEERRQPKNVKQSMLNHYEHVAPVFFDTIFFPLAAMNFQYDDIMRIVREAQGRGDDMHGLVRTACASDAMYEAMVAEYKRNFSALLGGRCVSVASHLEGYTRPPEGADVEMLDAERAIELTVRVVMYAYARGLRHSVADGKPSLRQATLFRLLLDAMNVLLSDEAAKYDDCEDDLAAMFLKVCQSQHNFTVMTSEMDRTYDELVSKEEIDGNDTMTK